MPGDNALDRWKAGGVDQDSGSLCGVELADCAEDHIRRAEFVPVQALDLGEEYDDFREDIWRGSFDVARCASTPDGLGMSAFAQVLASAC